MDCPDWLTSLWWLQMPWCQNGTRPSATTMLTWNWLVSHTSCFPIYISCCGHEVCSYFITLKQLRLWNFLVSNNVPCNCMKLIQYHEYLANTVAGPRLNIKTIFPGMGIAMLNSEHLNPLWNVSLMLGISNVSESEANGLFLTHCGWGKITVISHRTLSFTGIFLNENVWILLKISLKFVLEVRIHNISALVQIMTWRQPGDKPLSEPLVYWCI